MCNFAFKGMTFITSHYLINGYSSPQWTSLWKRYFEIDEDDARNEAADFWKVILRRFYGQPEVIVLNPSEEENLLQISFPASYALLIIQPTHVSLNMVYTAFTLTQYNQLYLNQFKFQPIE